MNHFIDNHPAMFLVFVVMVFILVYDLLHNLFRVIYNRQTKHRRNNANSVH